MKSDTQTAPFPSYILLPMTVAVTGAVLMILELTASRTLAPAIGTSLISWTGIIGTIMAWLSVGYLLGGRLADYDSRTGRPDENTHLPVLIMAGGFAILSTMLCANRIIAITVSIPDPYIRVLFACTGLFAVPTSLIGMIFPYAVKQTLRSLRNSGTVVGLMYTYSTIGSIFGTFLGGFYLLALFGNMKVLLLLAALLFILTLVHLLSNINKSIPILICTLIGLFITVFLWKTPRMTVLPGTVMDMDSLYNRIWIIDTTDSRTKRPVRLLKTGPGSQSSMFLDGGEKLSAPYLRFFRLVTEINPDTHRALLLGGGAMTFARDFVQKNSAAVLDVVEIDSALSSVASAHFSYIPDARITLIHADARLYVQNRIEQKKEPYDAVYIDVFDHAYAIPPHITTHEFVRSVSEVISGNGIVAVNIIGSVLGDTGKFLRAELATYRAVFPFVRVYPLEYPDDKFRIQNIVLLASKSPFLPTASTFTSVGLDTFINHEYTAAIPEDLPILTDDFAPVEQYMALL